MLSLNNLFTLFLKYATILTNMNLSNLKESFIKFNNTTVAVLIPLIEKILTARAKRKYILAVKAKERGLIMDWVVALFWAVGWVFLINQYLIQAYQIPSESMERTLLVGDRIFVNKLIFGPEVLPNFAKLPSPIKPKRSNIIIFQSPEYVSKGPLFEVVHRLLYMISFSNINLNKNAIDLLIKRAVGFSGDIIIVRDGDCFIKGRGDREFISEEEFFKKSDLPFNVQRLLPKSEYENSRFMVLYDTYLNQGLEIPFPYNSKEISARVDGLKKFTDENLFLNDEQIRYNSETYIQAKTLYSLYPWIKKYRESFYIAEKGIYVKDGYVLPLGDNRDNSHDGRAWGLVKTNKILGKPLFRFWPLDRMGVI